MGTERKQLNLRTASAQVRRLGPRYFCPGSNKVQPLAVVALVPIPLPAITEHAANQPKFSALSNFS